MGRKAQMIPTGAKARAVDRWIENCLSVAVCPVGRIRDSASVIFTIFSGLFFSRDPGRLAPSLGREGPS